VDLRSENLGVTRLLLDDKDGNQDDSHNDGRNNEKGLFHERFRTPGSPRLFYAIDSLPVPERRQIHKSHELLTLRRKAEVSRIPDTAEHSQSVPGATEQLSPFASRLRFFYVTCNRPHSSQDPAYFGSKISLPEVTEWLPGRPIASDICILPCRAPFVTVE
jgi:hypothetical protein